MVIVVMFLARPEYWDQWETSCQVAQAGQHGFTGTQVRTKTFFYHFSHFYSDKHKYVLLFYPKKIIRFRLFFCLVEKEQILIPNLIDWLIVISSLMHC